MRAGRPDKRLKPWSTASDFSSVEGSYSQLSRGNGLVAMELATGGLAPEAPYTAWWVFFNNPE